MSKPKVTIVDYGMGNLWSVTSAFKFLDADSIITGIPEKIVNADTLVLPGVGSFRNAMNALQKDGLDQAIIEAVQVRGVKILGICLGMQLMGLSSTEDGETSGLGLIGARVDKFNQSEVGVNKIPHIGFDVVRGFHDWPLFTGLPNEADFYFVHSYRISPDGLSGNIATCKYGSDFVAAYEKNNICATQFHPEKSQTNGLILLNNFLSQ